MKTQYIVLSFLFVLTSLFTIHAQKGDTSALKKETIKVWGECGMCKKKIENASKNAGATAADWNEDNKILTVSYNPGKTNAVKIQQAIATAGYDTKEVSAPAEAYENLPSCCHYQRKAVASLSAVNCCAGKMQCDKDQASYKDGKCDNNSSVCKDMSSCKEKGCCKS